MRVRRRMVSPRAVKRSITVDPEIDAAVVEVVGRREYSKFANEALLLALQARGVGETIADFERRHGALGKEHHEVAERRIAEARERAAQRSPGIGNPDSSCASS